MSRPDDDEAEGAAIVGDLHFLIGALSRVAAARSGDRPLPPEAARGLLDRLKSSTARRAITEGGRRA